MDINALLKSVNEMRKASAGNLTIGETLEKLYAFNGEEKITLTNGKFLDGTFDSYRGYYEDLAIGFSSDDKGFNTVGGLKDVLTKALDDGEMYGYKGGEYSIMDSTLVWLGNYGTTFEAEMLIDIQKVNGQIFVITKEED